MKNKMNKSNRAIIPVFICFLSGFMLCSCGLDKDSRDTGDEYMHSPPGNVHAEKEDGMVVVQWEPVAGAEAYQLFKNTGSGDSIKMDDGFTESDSYTYKEYNFTDTITYSVRCCLNGDYSSGISGCSNGIHQTKAEVMKALKPDVESFSLPGEIIIHWEGNPYATSYLLYRYTEPQCGQSTLIYEGDDLSYGDTDVIMGHFYYYKVVNKEGSTRYDASPYSFGVATYDGKDDYEDNETMDQATFLELNSVNTGTIYYFKDTAGNNLIDYDWYYVQVPAGTEIPIIIEEFDYTLDNDDLFITIGSDEKLLLKEGNGYKLFNPTNDTKDIFFSITVNPDQFYNEFGAYSIIVEE